MPYLLADDVMPALPWPYVLALAGVIAAMGAAYVRRETAVAAERLASNAQTLDLVKQCVPVLDRCARALEALKKET